MKFVRASNVQFQIDMSSYVCSLALVIVFGLGEIRLRVLMKGKV